MFATQLATFAAGLPLDVPQPTPTDIPGMEGIGTISGWIIGGAYTLLVIALIISGVKLGFAYKHGEASEAGKNIFFVLLAAVVIASAAPLINALT